MKRKLKKRNVKKLSFIFDQTFETSIGRFGLMTDMFFSRRSRSKIIAYKDYVSFYVMHSKNINTSVNLKQSHYHPTVPRCRFKVLKLNYPIVTPDESTIILSKGGVPELEVILHEEKAEKKK